MDSASVAKQVSIISANAGSLSAAALACKQQNLDPVACAPQLYVAYPSSSANDMANVLVNTWACDASSAMASLALGGCIVPGTGQPAFTAQQIGAAVAQSVSLTWLANTQINHSRMQEIGLFLGNLCTMTTAETVQVLVISTLPGDYSPTPGSLVGALAAIGVSVAALAQNKAANYLAQDSCWFSQPIAGQSFLQLLVFESTGAAAPAAIPGIFTALQAYFTSPPANLTVATAMLSTGSAGASLTAVLTALFNGAKASMQGWSGLTGLKITTFSPSSVATLLPLFNQLAGQ